MKLLRRVDEGSIFDATCIDFSEVFNVDLKADGIQGKMENWIKNRFFSISLSESKG